MVVVLAVVPVAEAAGLSARSDSMSSSQAGVMSNHVVSATTATASSIGSIKFEFCTTATGACVVPTGVVTTSASLAGQTGAVGFTMVNAVNGAPYLTRTASALGAGVPVSYALNSITNPTTVNQTFYVRMTTYSGTDGATGAVDTGTIAVSTAQPVQLTGVTPEILVFCVGTAIVSDCSTVSGNLLDFGDFDPLVTRTGTSVMQAQTNAANGYTITVNGTTLASGANTITALATQTASATSTAQFGLNLRANSTPPVGTEPAGGAGAIGAPVASYATANQYRFNSGDVVASAPAPTNANTFTSSYIVNIGGNQAAGVYTATMTYICTASF